MKPTYGRVSAATGSSRSRQLARPDRPVRPRRARRRRCSCMRSPAATSATRPRRPCPSRTSSLRPAGARRRGRTWLRGSASACRASTSSPGMEPGVEARVREAVAALEAAGAIVEDVSLPHTDYGLATYYIIAPAEASANLARYDGVRYGPRLGDGDDCSRNYLATRGRGLRRRGQAPDHARDVRALGRLLRRLLPEGAEGADADQGATSTRCWAQGFDALVAPTSPTVAFPFGRPDGRPGRDVPLGRLHAARQHGRSARAISVPCRPVRRAAGRPPVHRGAMVGARRCSVLARALRGDHRRRPVALDGADATPPGGNRSVIWRQTPMTADAKPRAPLAERALSQRVRAVPPVGHPQVLRHPRRRWTTSSASGWGSPTSTPHAAIVEAGVESLREGRTHYTSNYGTLELRRALADHLERRYGVRYDPANEILITVGASEAVDLALRATCDPGDEVHPPRAVVRGVHPGDRLRRRHRGHDPDALRGRLRARSGGRRGGDHAAHEGALPRLPVQSDRRRPPGRRPGRTRRHRRAPRPARLQRRDLRPPCLWHVPPPGDERPARGCASGRS